MDAADGRLAAGVVSWLFGEVLLDVRPKTVNSANAFACPLPICPEGVVPCKVSLSNVFSGSAKLCW